MTKSEDIVCFPNMTVQNFTLMSDLMSLINTYTSMGDTFAFDHDLSPGGRISDLSIFFKG